MLQRLLRPFMIACLVLALGGCQDGGDGDDKDLVTDTDGDGSPDEEELDLGSDPNDPDSTPDDIDGNGVPDDEEQDGQDDTGDEDGSTSGDEGTDDPDSSDGDDPGSSDGDEAATTACDTSTWTGCGTVDLEEKCTNHGDNGPILTTDYGGFSDMMLTIMIGSWIADDDVIQVVFLDEDAERVSLPVSGKTLKENEGTVYLVVPIQEASKAHTLSHVLLNGERVNAAVSGATEFTSGPFTEEGRCSTEEIEAAKAQVEADGTAI